MLFIGYLIFIAISEGFGHWATSIPCTEPVHLSPFGVELHRRFTGFFPVSTPLSKTLKKYAVLLGIMLALPLIGLMVLGVHGEHHFNTLLTSPKTAPPKHSAKAFNGCSRSR